MKTVIMAGGRGSRISSVISDKPKPMIEIGGVPVLERELICLREQGFTDIIITVSYLAEAIIEYFGDGSRFGVNIEYYEEDKPLGNAGALFKLRDRLSNPFLLLNADSIFDIDFNRLVLYHKAKGGLVTIFTHPNSHPYDSGIIVSDDNRTVLKWYAKEDEKPEWYKNRVNAGIHVIDPSVLDGVDIDEDLIGKEINGKVYKVDLDRQILKPLCGTGKLFCYDSPEYVRDMGTPDRYERVKKDYQTGIVDAKNLRNRQKAVFLDRDGTLNIEVGFLKNINDLELLPGVSDAVRMINDLGYLAIVVTNQPVVARGEVTFEQLDAIHNKLETLLGNEGAYLDAIYFCPHHPDSGYEGEIMELKVKCNCRKPEPGMLLKAKDDYNIDFSSSWMVGDSERDVMVGNSVGCRTAFIGEKDFGQTITVKSLLEFSEFLCSQKREDV